MPPRFSSPTIEEPFVLYLRRTVPRMSEQVFGLGVNQVMAYAAVANVLLVVVLAGINVYYAVHAKRQADASREQVARASDRGGASLVR